MTTNATNGEDSIGSENSLTFGPIKRGGGAIGIDGNSGVGAQGSRRDDDDMHVGVMQKDVMVLPAKDALLLFLVTCLFLKKLDHLGVLHYQPLPIPTSLEGVVAEATAAAAAAATPPLPPPPHFSKRRKAFFSDRKEVREKRWKERQRKERRRKKRRRR